MTFKDFGLLVFTFLFGLFAGAYFYIVVFMPTYDQGGVNEDIPDVSFDIVGIQYGGLTVADYEHEWFEIDNTGRYEYTPAGVGPQETESGTLPRVLSRELATALDEANLQAFSRAVSGKDCASATDGTDYEYSIILEGEEFLLDTCRTAFDNGTELGSTFLKLWTFMEDPVTVGATIRNTTDDAVVVDDEGVVRSEVREKIGIILNPVEFLRRGFEESFGN